jgi:hypothetical protein
MSVPNAHRGANAFANRGDTQKKYPHPYSAFFTRSHPATPFFVIHFYSNFKKIPTPPLKKKFSVSILLSAISCCSSSSNKIDHPLITHWATCALVSIGFGTHFSPIYGGLQQGTKLGPLHMQQ